MYLIEDVKSILWGLINRLTAISFKYLIVFFLSSGALFSQGVGEVITWGGQSRGGNSNTVANSLTSGVTQIFSNKHAFAALKSDGSVITWGDTQLPVGTEFTGMLSWQNMFDIGVSARSTSAMSILSVINLGTFEVGYAYETPTDNQLSALGMTTHEIVLRIKLGDGDDGEKQGPESTEE